MYSLKTNVTLAKNCMHRHSTQAIFNEIILPTNSRQSVTWIDFLVASHTICITDDLKGTRELVDSMVGRQLISKYRMQQRWYLTASQLLCIVNHSTYWYCPLQT